MTEKTVVNDKYAEEKNALRTFLKDTESLDKLEMMADKENIFDILSIENAEIRHSNFLSWLLDPSGNHHLGDIFLKKLLFKYSELSDFEDNIDVFDIDGMDMDDCLVFRELYHMDIIIQSRKSDFVLVIENKIRAHESKNQTLNYRKKVQDEFSNVKNKFFVYLTMNADDASDNKWVPMSHNHILGISKTIVNYLKDNSRSRIYVEDYINMMEWMVGMEETELEKLCAEIYSRHKKAIDILIDNIPDSLHIRANYIKNTLDKYPELIKRGSNNSYLRFTTQTIINKIGLRGTDEWVNSKDLLLFEIVNNRDGNIKFTLIVGPAENYEDHRILTNYLSLQLQNKQIKKINKWNRVYSETFQFDEDRDEFDKIEKKIETFVKRTIPEKIMPVIDSFPGF